MNFEDILRKSDFIETERLFIRVMKLEDVDDYFEYYRDKRISEFLDWDGPESLEKAREYIEFWMRGYDENWMLPCSIIDKKSHKVIGTIIFSDFIGKRVDIGYELSADCWRKGIMSEALKVMIDLIFKKTDIERIQAVVFDNNISSKRLLEKLKFKEEGVLRKYSYNIVTKKSIDSCMYALLREDIFVN